MRRLRVACTAAWASGTSTPTIGIASASWSCGKAADVAALQAAMPLMVFDAQPGAGVALRKELLKRRGALAHATVRQPA